MFSNTDSTKTEIIWALKDIMGGCSFCFNDELNETFTAMFPEFEIVKNVGLAITKSK